MDILKSEQVDNKLAQAQTILKIIQNNGYEAFIVGGAVRDWYLKLPLTEIDITTNCPLIKLRELFKHKNKGLKYGSITILFKNHTYEITLYRKEGPYFDYRHPSQIWFINDIKTDIKRRDFTINSLLLDTQLQMIDYLQGKQDLDLKQIKTIGDPFHKLTEDPVRMMRIFYLQAKLNFDIEPETQKVLQKYIFYIQKIKPFRLLEELKKILSQKYFYQSLLSLKKNQALSFLTGFQKKIVWILENRCCIRDIDHFLSCN